ncbi:MAG: cell division protein FtsA [Paludibacteraceae bacterium]|nr:cell division protein FtsA [Paludibacteraceae bacterium]
MTNLNDIAVEDLVVVMDLGSSKFRAAAGVRVSDADEGNSVELLCYNSVPSQGVKRGCVFNLETSAFAIKTLLQGLENQLNKVINDEREDKDRLKLKIKKVCVGLNGKSIKTTENQVLRTLGSEQIEVTQELMDSLYDEAKNVKMVNSEILKIVPQEFSIDDDDELAPIGCLANRISGRYKIVSGDLKLRKNLEACVKRAGYELANAPLAIEAAAMSVLSDEEMKSGCALFDFGGGTTSVAVYSKGVLRNLLVAPFGGKVITTDITCLKLQENVAEKLKKRFGSTLPSETEDMDIAIGNMTVNTKFLAEVVESRVDEIIDSIWQYLESTYSLNHINEIVMTGEGALLKNLQKKMTLRTGVDVRIGEPDYGNVRVDETSFGSFAKRPEFAQILGLLELVEAACVEEQPVQSVESSKPVRKPATNKTEKTKQDSPNLFSRFKKSIAEFADKVYSDGDQN